MKYFYLIILLLIVTHLFGTQNSERWEYHLSNIQTSEVVRGNEKIYFLSEGGIFLYDQSDSHIETITKIDGLSGSDFSGIEYNLATNSLVVFYESSMIDIINDDGSIFPISDIYRKTISGTKVIYNATSNNDLCYLSCSFGVVILDLTNREIKDSFIIGDDGDYQAVLDVCLDETNIYAATSDGLKYAAIDASNLLDYSNWQYIDDMIFEGYSINILQYGNDQLWAVHNDESANSDKTFIRDNTSNWQQVYTGITEITGLKIDNEQVVFCTTNDIYVYNESGNLQLHINSYPFQYKGLSIEPQSAIIDKDGTIWIADLNYGAIRYQDGTFDRLTPEGPYDNDIYSIAYSNNKIWIAGGGRTTSWANIWKPAIFQSYSEDTWEYFNSYTQPELDDYKDVVQVLPFPGDPNHIYVATWGGGILEYENGSLVKVHNELNSTLENIYSGKYYTRIGGIDFDSDGNLWVSNCEVEHCLHQLKIDGTWESYSLPELAYNYKLGQVMVTQDDNIWMIVPREKTSGLYVMSSDGSKKRQLDITSYFSNGSDELFVKMNDVYSIAEGNDGEIWVGTSKGIAVYNNPENVFDEDIFYAAQPGIDENDGIYYPLLQNQTVTAIAVDGGNRKWCGTKNSGIYLISSDGTEEIAHYNTDNSVLLSDVILSLEYNGDNGILYIGTEDGLATLLTDSKNSYSSFTDVYAYPNPVDRSKYDGDIYITGMMESSNVKITNISGRLVFETTSLGGQAVWDGNDLAGNKVHTGVYLVFCASEDGMESTITKILFIR